MPAARRRSPIVVYVAGPYRAATPKAEAANIRRAAQAAAAIWAIGFVALCPHLNSPKDPPLSRRLILRGDLELMRRCDAIFLIEGWKASPGALAEYAEAARLGMCVFHSMKSLRVFAARGRL